MPRTASKLAPKPTQANIVGIQPRRRSVPGLDDVIKIAPNEGLAANLSRTYGLDPIDYDAIRNATGEQIKAAGETLSVLNERALQIHLQRIVGSWVVSAYGAAQFYSAKVSTVIELTSRLGNGDRDEDRDGPSGFESKAERARLFAAQMGLQSYALCAAAEGAVLAYAEVTGETWKPYQAPPPAAASVSRRSAVEQMAAF
jgi:hypothetical protein